ncbi:hypothetical protein ABHE73_000045 [Salmonella enterica]
MTTISNNKLPEWRKTLNKSVENYQSTQAWYEENPDNPSAEQDMDAAAGEIEKLIKQYGVLIVLNLLDEIDELQERRKADSAPSAPVMPAELHPDTQNLVANFSTALAEKLYKAQLKYGYDADWKQDGWATQCQSHFHQHIAKGDPRDVAAYCAFMWYHGWKTESVSGPVVPKEMPKGLAAQIVNLLAHNIGDKLLAQKIWNACRAVMLQSKYRDLSQPVDPQISEYEKIILQAGNSPVIPDGYALVPVEPTDEMIAAAMECDDVVFDSKDPTAFCVQYREIYCAMVDTAPALNKGEY